MTIDKRTTMTELELDLFGQPRKIYTFPLSAIKPSAREGAQLRLRVNTVAENQAALRAATKYQEKHPEECRKDPDYFHYTRAAFALHTATRHIIHDDLPAFQDGEFMLDQMTPNMMSDLLQLYNECSRSETKTYIKEPFTKEQEDAIVQMCQETSETDTPNILLASLPSEMLAELVIRLSNRLKDPAV
jgi:hypothetical protein